MTRLPRSQDQDRVLPKRAWTQLTLDQAISEYVAKQADVFHGLVDAVKKRNTGAKQRAQELFGQRRLVKELGVKSPAMVTYSLVWQEIADALGLRNSKLRRLRAKLNNRESTDAIAGELGGANGKLEVVDRNRRETIRFIENSPMSKMEAEAAIEKLLRGDLTDEQARGLVRDRNSKEARRLLHSR